MLARLQSILSLKTAAEFFAILLPVSIVLIGRAAIDICASMVAVLFIIHVIRQRETAWLSYRWVQLLLLFWGYALLRSLFTATPLHSLTQAFIFGRFIFLAFGLAFWVVDSEKISHRLLVSTLLAVSLLAVDGLVQYITGVDLLGKPRHDPVRLTGPFRRPIIGAVITWLMFPAITWLLSPPSRPNRKLQYAGQLALAFLIFTIVLLSGERSALLLSLLGGGLLFFLYPLCRGRIFFIGAVFLTVGALVFFIDPAIQQRQVHSTSESVSGFFDTPYGKIWLDASRIIKENPITGVGMKNYNQACIELPEKHIHCQLHPHNFYLEIIAETGLIGTIIFISAMIAVLVFFVKHWRYWRNSPIITGSIVGFLIRLWPLIAVSSFYNAWNIVPMWFLLGWSMGQLQNKIR